MASILRKNNFWARGPDLVFSKLRLPLVEEPHLGVFLSSFSGKIPGGSAPEPRPIHTSQGPYFSRPGGAWPLVVAHSSSLAWLSKDTIKGHSQERLFSCGFVTDIFGFWTVCFGKKVKSFPLLFGRLTSTPLKIPVGFSQDS